ncbi:ABC transporter ATP-binding protein [Enterococcus sp. BWR-S5]|uniref:ABC transporter ATP-binding protein n=1 Tax=Enterococcus sp. BWR-S5 TaxID=2787714 RepID=UPI0019237084|nr:ABC transporter ATP-binding protein [Enterococcus sp. BWR-S5]MBL1224014.1 ABC transporter ATP-binding protein [Enterococcus sp. BWR-S5]
MTKHEQQESMDSPKELKQTSRRLLKLLGQQKSKFLLIIFSAFCFATLMAVTPLILGWGLDNLIALIRSGDFSLETFISELKLPVLLLLLSWGMISLFSLLQEYTMASVSETLILTLRKQITGKLNKLPIRFYDQYKTGDILSRTILDLDKVSEVLQVGLMQLITSVISIVFGVIAMLILSPLLTLGILFILLLSSYVTKKLAMKNQAYFAENQLALGEVGAKAEELYSGNLVIKAYNQQHMVQEEMDALNDRQFEAFRKAQFVSFAINPLIRFINQIGFVISAVVGGFLVISGQLSIGLIQAYLQYINQVSEPVTQASYIINTLQSALAALERIFEILDAAEEVETAEPLPVPETINGDVSFQHIAFGYTPEKQLMKDVSFTVKPKQSVAIVGPTGAGKTTMINLLMRFYPLNGGQINVDNIDISRFSSADIRQKFGMVLQDTWLYQGTIAENIAYGKPNASRPEVIAAAKAAQCDHFIRTLPQGYDTLISSEGNEISQGQQQLLTIARAILADPSILILDEATSSVDTRTEKLIQQAMDHLTQGRTSFIIAHRLSTIKNADLILVMKDGDIIEKGTHQQLLSQESFYANLYNSQFAST